MTDQTMIFIAVEQSERVERHTHQTIRGEKDTVIRSTDYVAVALDQDGRTLLSKVCDTETGAWEFLRSEEARGVYGGRYASYVLMDEDVTDPSEAFRQAIAKIK